jgi:hypothetical protein
MIQESKPGVPHLMAMWWKLLVPFLEVCNAESKPNCLTLYFMLVIFLLGAPSRSKPILAVLDGLRTQQESLTAALSEANAAKIQLPKLEQSLERHRIMQGEFDTKTHQATLLRTRIEQSAHGRLELEAKALEEEIGKVIVFVKISHISL